MIRRPIEPKCANILAKVKSVYRWQGRIERESEVPLLVKIRETSFDAVTERVSELHPYDFRRAHHPRQQRLPRLADWRDRGALSMDTGGP